MGHIYSNKKKENYPQLYIYKSLNFLKIYHEIFLKDDFF